MTTGTEKNANRSFTTTSLPWVLAAAALLAYIITLNKWLALSGYSAPPYASNSLAEVARVSGWMWQPSLTEPLYWLLTLPLRFLPDAQVPMALNLLAAFCAAASLWQLARSVSILPHDRTEDQRQRERHASATLTIRTSWLPPTLAVLVCGLQLSFWENATVASGEMLNLLLFAYVVRCLLEFRLDGRESWIWRGVFVFAAAITNNWGMIGYAPLFLIALLWLKGFGFFRARFAGRLAIFAFAGLLFYLLLPIVAVLSANVDLSFWQALKHNIGTQKGLATAITFNKGLLFFGDRPLWVLALPSLIPLVVLAIRWPAYFGDRSRFGIALATIVFHVFHAVLFGVCLWAMLDPQFTPRHMVTGTPLLSLYYLCALSVGYVAGYIALVFGVKPPSSLRHKAGLHMGGLVNGIALTILWAAFILTPAALIYRNYPVIGLQNGSIGNANSTALRSFAEASAVTLPAEGGVVISDDVRKLTLVRSLLVAQKKADKFLFLDTQSLAWPQYHAFLEKDQPGRWKNFVPTGSKGQIDPNSLIHVLYYLSQSNKLYYLHPSFGYYFEAFWMEPQGLAYRLHAHTTNSLMTPPLSKQVLAYNQSFWAKADQGAVSRLLRQLHPPRKKQNLAEQLVKKAKLKRQESPDQRMIGGYYSRARNTWAVDLQRANQWEPAEDHLKKALELNENNAVAKVNHEVNQQHRSGAAGEREFSDEVKDLFGYRSWDRLVNDNGPFDEPQICFEQGRLFFHGSLFRQAAGEFNRTRQLNATHVQARLWLAQAAVITRWPDLALEVMKEVREIAPQEAQSGTNALEVMAIEATALFIKGEGAAAVRNVEQAVARNSGDDELLGTATQVLMSNGAYTNALTFIERQIQRQPTNVTALVNQGFAYIQVKQFERAIPPLTRALELATDTSSELHRSALFNRAIACLQGGKLEDAEGDFTRFLKLIPDSFKAHYGLAETAYRKKDTNAALRHYELYMANAPTNTQEAELVRTRIKELKGGQP